MQVIRQLSTKTRPTDQRTVLTIGSYDGIHRGHKQIIAELKRTAQNHNAASALITFYPRPKIVLGAPQNSADYLTTLDEKLLIFNNLGLDIVAILPFTTALAQTPARDFVQQIINTLNPLAFWVGPDFKFGKNRQGDIPYLEMLGREFDFSVRMVDLQLAGNEAISSTRIRNALTSGHIREVTRLLGDYPFLLGNVVKGAQRGRTIGFPTANIAVDKEKLLPLNGVYAVRIHIDGKIHPAVANIGVRPTFNGDSPTIEVHIFDFEQDIYGDTVRVDLVEFIRPEQKFDSLEALVSQISLDAQQAKSILRAEDSSIPPAG